MVRHMAILSRFCCQVAQAVIVLAALAVYAHIAALPITRSHKLASLSRGSQTLQSQLVCWLHFGPFGHRKLWCACWAAWARFCGLGPSAEQALGKACTMTLDQKQPLTHPFTPIAIPRKGHLIGGGSIASTLTQQMVTHGDSTASCCPLLSVFAFCTGCPQRLLRTSWHTLPCTARAVVVALSAFFLRCSSMFAVLPWALEIFASRAWLPCASPCLPSCYGPWSIFAHVASPVEFAKRQSLPSCTFADSAHSPAWGWESTMHHSKNQAHAAPLEPGATMLVGLLWW